MARDGCRVVGCAAAASVALGQWFRRARTRPALAQRPYVKRGRGESCRRPPACHINPRDRKRFSRFKNKTLDF